MYTLYADGACKGNPGPGGWAYRLFEEEIAEGSAILGGSGSRPDTTNNIMELRAVIAALEDLRDSGHPAGQVTLRLDSEYVLKGLFEWLPGWKARGWKTSGKKPVKNRELWEQLDGLKVELETQGFSFTPDWVKGHAGDYGNELVDTIAQDEAARALDPVEDTSLPSVQGPAPSSDEINQMQVDLMSAILEGWKTGHSSVRDVIAEIRANAVALGLREID